jgi:hypothetical protein
MNGEYGYWLEHRGADCWAVLDQPSGLWVLASQQCTADWVELISQFPAMRQALNLQLEKLGHGRHRIGAGHMRLFLRMAGL